MDNYSSYVITCKVSGMQYIGITSIGVKERWYAHISCSRSLSSNNPMYKDMKEFGEKSFEIHEIESGLSKEEADVREKELVKEYNTKWPNGYNLTDGGFKNDGVILSKDRSARISDKLRGVPKSDEHKLHLSQSRIGKYKGQDNAFYGRHHSDETILNLQKILSHGKVYQLDKKSKSVVNEFDSAAFAARYISENKLSSAKVDTINSRLCEVMNSDNRSAYGFMWRRDEGQSTNY